VRLRGESRTLPSRRGERIQEIARRGKERRKKITRGDKNTRKALNHLSTSNSVSEGAGKNPGEEPEEGFCRDLRGKKHFLTPGAASSKD